MKTKILAIIMTTSFAATPAGAQVLPAAIDCDVDYTFVREKVFTPQCIKCHGGEKIKGGVDLASFSEAVKHLTKIHDVVTNDEMPPTSSLSATEAEIVLAWVSQGGKETADPQTACVSN